MSFNTKLLADICEAPGAPGFEKAIRKLIHSLIKDLADEIYTDNIGNIVAIKRGKSSEQRIMAAAHMDEIGFIVNHIDDKGFIRFHPLGGFDPKTLTSQRVIIHGKKDLLGVMGAKPIHIMAPEERGKAPQLKDYFIDTGLSKKEVEKIISIGDPVTRLSPLLELGECVNVKSLDNRVCVFLLIETLRALSKAKKKPAYDFYAVFSVQEEVGLRGATASAQDIKPTYAFGLDTTIAFDTPGSTPQERVTALGEGVAIKIMDSSVICDYRMVAFMKEIAENEKITWQPEILPAGGTDTAALQRHTPGGSIAGAISIPTRHIHQTIEMAHKADIQGGIDLLTACVLKIDKGNWQF